MRQLHAEPLCGQCMAGLRARVIQCEPPGFDGLMRQRRREKHHGKSLWWPFFARIKNQNEKWLTPDLCIAESQECVDLLQASDTKCNDYLALDVV